MADSAVLLPSNSGSVLLRLSMAITTIGVYVLGTKNLEMDTASTTSSVASSAEGRSGSGSDFINRGMFSSGGSIQQQQSVSSGENLLVGGTGGGFPLGNGFGNDMSTGLGGGVLSSSGTSFDLSDFPSLGGGAGGGGGATQVSGNGLAAALREQQQILAHQQMLQGIGGGSPQKGTSNLQYILAMTGSNGGNFSMANEDFPALGVVAPSQTSGSTTTNSAFNTSALLSSNSSSIQQSSSNENGIYGGSIVESMNSQQLDGGAGLLGSAGLASLGGLRNLGSSQQMASSTTPSSGIAPAGTIGSATAPSGSSSGSTGGNSLTGDYGLLGLLGVIRMTESDRNSLALGSDLNLLGLGMASAEQIYSTFSSPWSDSGPTREPHYQLPMCYYMQPPALKTGHLSKFQLETLFYIFYALPKDVLQAYAAQELYAREWRFHGELKLWFKRAGPSDGVANSATGSPQYLYFDINSWERRLFNGSMNQNVTSGFLPEDEVRVKFPSS